MYKHHRHELPSIKEKTTKTNRHLHTSRQNLIGQAINNDQNIENMKIIKRTPHLFIHIIFLAYLTMSNHILFMSPISFNTHVTMP
jgi:histone deacetylase complex regulatory component SIN3